MEIIKLMGKILLIAGLMLISLISGYFMGFNDGFDSGVLIGRIDEQMAAQGLIIKHHGTEAE